MAADAARVGLVLLPGFSLAALAGVVEVLHAANQVLDAAAYEPVLLATQGTSVAAAGGVPVAVRPLADAPALLAALVVSDGPGPSHTDGRHAPLLAWLVAQAAAGRTLGGVGTGAAWLAEAGLLRGHRATLHWPHIAPLAQRHADVVVSRRRYEIDRQRLSCAGQQASRDLCIAWLAQRHGAALAPALAAQLGMRQPHAADEDQRVPVSARCSCVAAAHSRNGTSLATSAAIRPRPQGSCVVAQGGGALNPVAQGDSRRSSHPLGASRNASPIAKAACGTASMGGSACTVRCHGERPGSPGKLHDSTHAASAADSANDSVL